MEEIREAWKLISDAVDEKRTPYRARALVVPGSVHLMRWILGNRVRIGPAGADGRIEVELRAHGLGALAAELAGLGDRIEVVDPPELRAELLRIGDQLRATYA